MAPDGTAWVVGEGIVARSKGGAFDVLFRSESDEYQDVRAFAADDVWIAGDSNEVGSAGLLLHWDGKRLVRHENLTANFLSALTRTRDGTLWAVGLGGVMVHSPLGGEQDGLRPAASPEVGLPLVHRRARSEGSLVDAPHQRDRVGSGQPAPYSTRASAIANTSSITSTAKSRSSSEKIGRAHV